MASNATGSFSSAPTRRALSEAAQRLAGEIDLQSAQPPAETIKADPYVVSSLLQKSIRRGERQMAQRAGLTLFRLRGSSIWRRMMVIAFEDVGVGSVEALTGMVAAASDATWRKACGGDARVAAHLAGMLADAPKDRSADYLGVASKHPKLKDFAKAIGDERVHLQLWRVRDQTLTLPERAIAISLASSLGSHSEGSVKRNSEAILALFGELGAPEELIAATAMAVQRTSELITVLVPLIWLAANSGAPLSVSEIQVPKTQSVAGIPLYTFDKHTRLGKQAIRELIRSDAPLRSCLQMFVPESRWQAAIEMAAFYADAAPVSRRLEWSQSRSIEELGKEADFAKVGVPLDAISPLQAAIAVSLGTLNDIRSALWLKASASGSARG